MQQQFKWSATSLMFVAMTASVSVVADAVNAQNTVSPASPESQLIREVSSDPLSARVTQPVAQVTSVAQLSDVRATDWAFTALQSLVERYNCIAGYPDRTFRGQQAMTRFEFAAGLNACLDRINEIIAAGMADRVSREDLESLARLQEDFAAELASLRGRMDAVEGRVATIERQQFSTNTQLRGEVIFAFTGGSDGVGPDTILPPPAVPAGVRGPDRTNITFSYRARLDFRTTFTGRDLLRTRLNMGNTRNPRDLVGGDSTRLSFESDTGNNTQVDSLFYRFPIGDTNVWVGALMGTDDVLSDLSPVSSAGQGTISRFGRFNPLLRIGGIGAGVGADFRLNPQANLQIFYGSSDPALGITPDATDRGGFFGSDSLIAAQLVFRPAPNIDLGISYGNSSHGRGSLRTGLNNDTAGLTTAGTGLSANTVAGNLVWRFAPNASFFTWGSWTFTSALAGPAADATFTSWVAGFTFDNLLGRGDRAAIFFGQPLFRESFSGAVSPNLPTTTAPYHLEAFYNFRVTPNISITPGVFFVFNPNSDSRLGTATVGVLRTTFTF